MQTMAANEKLLQILAPFLDGEGRLTAFPAKRKKKNYALLYLAGKLAPDTTYTEREVNGLLLQWHTFGDPATLRRELYDHRLLDRTADCKTYRRRPVLPTVEELEQYYR